MSQSVDDTDRAIDLSRFDNDFQREKIDESNTVEAIPDGKYRVIVQEVLLKETQASRNPMVRWTLARRWFADGRPAAVEEPWDHEQYTEVPQDGAARVRPGPAIAFGAAQRLDQMRNIQLEVTKRTKGPNDNIYFNRRIPDGDAGLSDDLPF
jgi:hypothetical protein